MILHCVRDTYQMLGLSPGSNPVSYIPHAVPNITANKY